MGFFCNWNFSYFPQQQKVSYAELKKEGESLNQYLTIDDSVKKFIQPGHNWYPTVTKIEEVKNPGLRVKFLKCSLNLFDPEPTSVWKFHGTSDEGVKGITQKGFKLPTKAGMYGAGIYLATDSSKSAQEIYTKVYWWYWFVWIFFVERVSFRFWRKTKYNRNSTRSGRSEIFTSKSGKSHGKTFCELRKEKFIDKYNCFF